MGLRAAIFDLDRTLVPVNTASLFMKWQLNRGEARRRDLARTGLLLAQYTLGAVDAARIARYAARPLIGRNEERFASIMHDWTYSEIVPRVTAHAREEIARRREQGYIIAILTGSTPYSAVPLGNALGIDHILGSQLEVKEGVFTGELVGPLCFGAGKVARAEQWASEHDIDLTRSAFYSDSISDLPMLERVQEPFAVNPDPRLRLLAKWRGWPRLYWR